jgi:hypothetical protein
LTFDTIATGSYASASGGASGNVYVGGVQVHVQLANTGVTFYGNPSGDFYSGPTCTTPTTQPLIPVKGTVTSSDPVVGASVACTYPAGPGSFYQRVGFNYTIALTGTCRVNGGAETATVERHTGVLTSCDTASPRPPKFCTSADTFVALGP